jgi:NO-binding membrane sensor protein with MHYT domain
VGHISQTAYGWITPALAYLAAVSGSAVALRSVRWALLCRGLRRARWLCVAAWALGSGIWTMHFIAMLGFSVSGMDIRYDVHDTVESLLLAVAVVGVGLFVVGYGRHRGVRVLLAGAFTGLGIAGMHYLGMAGIRMGGVLRYDPTTVGISVAIAIVAATAALWATLNVRGTLAVLGAAMVMGVAVSAMHYTGMRAVSVTMHHQPLGSTLPGQPATSFVLPLFVGFGLTAFFNFTAYGFAPREQDTRRRLATA